MTTATALPEQVVQACERVALDTRDHRAPLLGQIRQAQLTAFTRPEIRLSQTLERVAYRQPDLTAARLDDIAQAVIDRDRHALTSGCWLCCGGECGCTAGGRLRCDRCEGAPQQGVEQAAEALLDLVADTLGQPEADLITAAARPLTGAGR